MNGMKKENSWDPVFTYGSFKIGGDYCKQTIWKKIPFQIWYPLFADADGTFYLPDFTVTVNGEDYYIEHLGRLDDKTYRAHWDKKEKWYNKHFPGETINDNWNGRQSKDIDFIIDDLLSK